MMWSDLSIKERIERVAIITCLLMLIRFEKGDYMLILLIGLGLLHLHDKIIKTTKRTDDLEKELAALKANQQTSSDQQGN